MNVKVSYIFRFISMLYTDSMHGERACKILMGARVGHLNLD